MTYFYYFGFGIELDNYKFALLEEALVLLPYTNSSGLHFIIYMIYNGYDLYLLLWMWYLTLQLQVCPAGGSVGSFALYQQQWTTLYNLYICFIPVFYNLLF